MIYLFNTVQIAERFEMFVHLFCFSVTSYFPLTGMYIIQLRLFLFIFLLLILYLSKT